MNDVDLIRVLRLCARLNWDQSRSDQLARLTSPITAWDELVEAAEKHGLAPLLSVRLSEAGVLAPTEAKQQLVALKFIHRDANATRLRVLGQIVKAFNEAALPVIVLKGAALAHLLYPSVGLRPFGDLDLLVDPSDAVRAQQLLSTLGFAAPAPLPHVPLAQRHHLPIATKMVDGLLIQVEIHTNALTYDTPGQLTMRDLSGPPQPFVVEGQQAQALGHADMLYHLCRHTAERAALLRLIWVADVVGYADRYRSAISWEALQRRYPFVLNALALFHLLIPLPASLLEHVTPPASRDMQGVGVACKPVSELFKTGRSAREIAGDVFGASEWWLRLYYGVDDRAPLWWYRFVRHPTHVGYWLLRRAAASLQSHMKRARR